MLNRYIIAKDLKFIFDNINDLNNEKIYTYMLENKGYKEPDDIHKSIENLYYEILLNEKYKEYTIQELLELTENIIDNFKGYIAQNKLDDKFIQSKFFLLDLEYKFLCEFLKSREHVRNLRKGFKKI